jgi:hypothetical protein
LGSKFFITHGSEQLDFGGRPCPGRRRGLEGGNGEGESLLANVLWVASKATGQFKIVQRAKQ